MIKDLIAKGMIDSKAKIVLVNAIYFKKDWNEKFDPNSTMKKPFHVTPNKTVTVEMMQMTSFFKVTFSEELDATILDMPYEGKRLSMWIILPKKYDGLQGNTDVYD